MNKLETFAFDAVKSVRTFDENGFMHVEKCNISKETVNPYYGHEIPGFEELGLDPEKIYYGYRPLTELEKAADTFNNLNLLSEHVEDGADKNNEHLIIGSLGDSAATEAPYLVNSLAVKKKSAIDDIESKKKKELSCAYRYVPVMTSGVFEGKKYDFIMTQIRGNHVALVEKGRAGSDVVVADSQLKGETKMGVKDKLKTIFTTKKITMDEDAISEVAEALEEAVETAVAEKVEEVMASTPDPNSGDNNPDDGKTAKDNDYIEILKSKGLSDEEIKQIVALIKGAEAAVDNDPKPPAEDEEEVDKKVEEKVEEKVKAMDSAIRSRYKNMHIAAKEVRPLIGELEDPMTFDSAESIYKKALEIKGVNIKDLPSAAYRGMVQVLTNKPAEKVVGDSTPEDLTGNFEYLKNIKLG